MNLSLRVTPKSDSLLHRYDSEEPCVASEEAFLACKESEQGMEVELYLGDTLVKTCGGISENEGLAQENQTFK